LYQVSRFLGGSWHGSRIEEESADGRYLLLVIYVVCPLSIIQMKLMIEIRRSWESG